MMASSEYSTIVARRCEANSALLFSEVMAYVFHPASDELGQNFIFISRANFLSSG
jgi:hypothetical protein